MTISQKEIERGRILNLIINILKEAGEKSIADLQRETNLKRSTLIYYLGLLEVQGYIEKERIEKKKTGRPTMIKLKKEKIAEIKKGEKKIKRYTIEILKGLKNGGEMTLNDFHNLNPVANPFKKDLYFKDKFQATLNVEYSPLSEKIIRISKEGEKFLENSLKTTKPKEIKHKKEAKK